MSVLYIPGTEDGWIRQFEAQTRGAAANWWDPNNVGLSIAGAYRAINSVGTPWPGGPTAYLQSLVNQANPGVNDLTEGNGAVPWVQATGWGFVAAFAQWFDTGLVPISTWSVFVQYANVVTNTTSLFGVFDGANQAFLIQPTRLGNRVRYDNGGNVSALPQLATGNLGIAGASGFRNGVVDGVIPAGVDPVSSLFIGAANAGGPIQFITADIESIALYNGGAAAVQVEAAAIRLAQTQL